MICRNTASRIAGVVWLLALVLATGCQRPNQYVAPPPPDVTVSKPLVRDVPSYAYFTGTTRAYASVQVRARVQGYLQSIHFDDNDEVQRGQLLFVIDPAPFEAKLAAAKADLASKKALVVKTNAVYRRTLSLVRSGAATPEEADKEKGNYEVAKADVLQAQANVQEAQVNLDYTRILSPIDGTIGRHQLDIGNLVTADNTLLTTIEDYNPMYAYFNVNEQQLLEFMRLGREQGHRLNVEDDRVTLRNTALTTIGLLAPAGAPAPLLAAAVLYPPVPRAALELELANEKGYPHQGRLDFVDLGVDVGTGTIQVRGVFGNPKPHVLLPGLFVRIRAPIGTHENALLVSERALGTDQAGQYLLVVKEDTVERRPVKVGTLMNGMRVIEEGVGRDDWVIVKGLQRAIPGSKVKPTKKRMKDE